MRKIVLFVLMALVAISCRQDPEANALLFVNPTASVALSTKAAITDGRFPLDREIVFSAWHKSADATEGLYFQDVRFGKNEKGLWQSSYYWPKDGAIALLGYSTKQMNVLPQWDERNPTSVVVMDVPDNNALQEDLLVGCCDLTPRCRWIEMEMQHPFALLTFSAQSDCDYSMIFNTGVSLTGITVSSASFGGRLAAQRVGTELKFFWTDILPAVERKIDEVKPQHLYTNETSNIGQPLLVVPGSQQEMTVYYTIHNGFKSDGTPDDRALQYTVTPEGSWQAGIATNYLIRITVKEVSVETRVALWKIDPQTIEF